MTALVLLFALAPQESPKAAVADPGFELAVHQVADLDRDGRAEILCVGRDGRVRTLRPLAGAAAVPAGDLTLPDPKRTLLDFTELGGRAFLVAQTPKGTIAYPLLEGGRVSSEGTTWIPRARFTMRLEAPAFARIVGDVNRDGTPDVVVPTWNGVELWLGSAPEGDGAGKDGGADGGAAERGQAPPSFRKTATVAVDVLRWGSHQAELLSDSLEGSFAIPALETRDVNGDGRPDLIVEHEKRRAFHLQRADGAFPLEPDVDLDLGIFRDTIPSAPMQLGGTLTIGDEATYSSSDLDGDGIPDYVIGHRRKVWVFRGTQEGPQFKEPSAILKTAEDITALLVAQLDADERPDLLLVKVQIPTLATLLRGLFGEWDVRIRALAYRNVGEGRFETSPSLSNELLARLPGIVGLIKNPESILERFEDLEKRFRSSVRGDVDGNGGEDVLLVTVEQTALEVWLEAPGASEDEPSGSRTMREILFEDENRVWDVDRLVSALGSFAQRRVALLTGGRPPDRTLPLEDPERAEIVEIQCADFDGDGADEVVIAYKRRGDPRSGWFAAIQLDEKDGTKK